MGGSWLKDEAERGVVLSPDVCVVFATLTGAKGLG